MAVYTPKFSITNTILTAIGAIEAAREVIMHAPLIPLYEKRFQEEALLRTVHHGTHIEGNRLSKQEVKDVLAGGAVRARDRDIQEIINYRNVITYIDAFKGDKPISQEVVLAIHRLTTKKVLPDAQSGIIRTTAVVVKDSRTGEVSFTPPPPQIVTPQLLDLLTWLESKASMAVHPVLKAGIVHYSLARIHPFVDGNGRTARAVATLCLFKDGYDIRKLFSLEEYFDGDALRYYRVLQAVSNQLVSNESERDLTVWLEYFTEGLTGELVRVKERVVRLSVDVRRKGRMGQIGLSDRQMRIVEFIEDHSSISNAQWRTLFPSVSDDTILRDLKDLMKKKVIKKRGKTKAAVYLLR